MSIKVKVNTVAERPAPTFPALRIWAADATSGNKSVDEWGPLIVLFTANTRGIVLSGRPLHQLGQEESCFYSIEDDSEVWLPCSVTLSSED